MLFQQMRVRDIQTVFRFRPRQKNFASKSRHNHILGVKLSGRSAHYFEDRMVVLEAGQVYYFNPKDDYTVEELEPGSVLSVHFSTWEPSNQATFFADVESSADCLACLEQLEKSFLSGGTTPQSLSDLYRLMAVVASKVQLPDEMQNHRMAAAKDYMQLHFKEKDCIAQAAAVYGVTPRRFTDLFSKEYGATPNRYIQQLKVKQAERLLVIRDLTLAQIAELCGFSDVYYFSKVFKQETGQNPGALRKLL